MAGDLPQALCELLTELEARGFSVVADGGGDALGSRVIELAHPHRETAARIRLDRDRGLWSVGISIGDSWRDPYQVLLARDKSEYAARASNHDERRRFTLSVLDRLPASSSELAPEIERLDAYHRK